MNANTHAKKTRPRCQPSFRRPILIVGLLLIAAMLASGEHREYAFTRDTRPVDVMASGAGKWLYYMPSCPVGGSAQTAAEVRSELLPQGFTEDTTSRPWYRFTKGGREVIVCYHNEIATNGGFLSADVLHETPPDADASKDVVVWVRQPGADPIGVACFQVEKLVFRW